MTASLLVFIPLAVIGIGYLCNGIGDLMRRADESEER
jgi:hypothetical protein